MATTNYWQKFEQNQYYHIYNRGINGCHIFAKPKNYYFFLDKWKSLIHPFFETQAYCLMPSHFHFLVKVKTLSPKMLKYIAQINTSKSRQFINSNIDYNSFLEDQFKRIFSSYALAFNKEEKRTGSLFQKRFKRVIINHLEKQLYTLAYIHHNPIRHNVEKDFGAWQFSSYSAYVSTSKTLITREKVLAWFDDDVKVASVKFSKYHQEFKLKKEQVY